MPKGNGSVSEFAGGRLPRVPWGPAGRAEGLGAGLGGWALPPPGGGVAGLRRAKRRARRVPAHLEAALGRWNAVGSRGRAARLRRTDWPAPLHLGPALAGYRMLSLADRLRVGRAALAMRFLGPRVAAVDVEQPWRELASSP